MPNVPSDLSLLAFGIPPAREAGLAGGMPKVPKGQGLGRLARSDYLLAYHFIDCHCREFNSLCKLILYVDIILDSILLAYAETRAANRFDLGIKCFYMFGKYVLQLIE
jgi:hypothetical protein